MTCRVCLATLLPDGTCRYKCPPELRRSAVRHAQVQAKKRVRDAERRDSSNARISTEERTRMRKAVTKLDPATGEFSRRMWARKGGKR